MVNKNIPEWIQIIIDEINNKEGRSPQDKTNGESNTS